MNENEKAATFIGWRPTDFFCPYHGDGCLEPECEDRRKVPAPDMSRPRNYMKALEGLIQKYGAIQVTLVSGWVGISTPGWERVANGDTWLDALAALYDAEHPGEIGR
jgi:hypothetical protein